MARLRDANGTVYALTVFSAIQPGREEDVRAVIEGLPRGEGSPLAKLPVHTSRMLILDGLVYQGAPQRPDTLNSRYLLFTAWFDLGEVGGTLEGFLDLLVDRIADEAERWWRHCVAFPGFANRTAFKQWIVHNQIHTVLGEISCPNETVRSIRDALSLRERVLKFAIDAQGLSAADLHDRFRRTFAEAT